MFNKNTQQTPKEQSQLLSTIFSVWQSYMLPILSLFIIVGLSVTVGKSMVEKILKLQANIKESTKKNEILLNKKQLLGSLKEEELRQNVKLTTVAIPVEGPILPGIVALRFAAASKNISLNRIRFSVPEGSSSKIKAVDFVFDTEGSLEDTVSFLNDLKNMAPLSRVKSLKFSINERDVVGNIAIHSLWEPLPETFGKIDDPIDPIEQAEKELIAKLSKLKVSPFSLDTVGVAAGRKNPFSF